MGRFQVVVYAGGYGGECYTASLRVLCDSALNILGEDFVFVFSPHPGYPSTYEAGLFQEWGCLPPGGQSVATKVNLLVGTEEWALSTTELVVASNGSISDASTVTLLG